MFGLLRTHRLVYQGCCDVGGGVSSLAFHPRRPFGALAGQHGIVCFGLTAMKPFSLASAPEEDSVLIGTSLASASAFKQRLAALRPGDEVTLRGPVNKFILDKAPGRVVLLAQGVGITPLRAMLAHIALGGLSVDSSLIHVSNKGHAYRGDTETWATRAAYPEHSDKFTALAAEQARAYPKATFYIAGASRFVTATTTLLRDCGVASGDIRQDKYLGYRPRTQAAAETTVHAPRPSAA